MPTVAGQSAPFVAVGISQALQGVGADIEHSIAQKFDQQTAEAGRVSQLEIA